MGMPLLRALLLGATCAMASARVVTLRNDISRVDTAGAVIDCHSGVILAVNGTFYMYGERYGNSTGFGPSPPVYAPRIVVYTSIDLMVWEYRGFVLQDWPSKPNGTFFTPWAVYNRATQRFVLWFNAYEQGCCTGNWGVATSVDGVNFSVLTMNQGGKYAVVDGNGLFVDDDGTAYNIYTSEVGARAGKAQAGAPLIRTAWPLWWRTSAPRRTKTITCPSRRWTPTTRRWCQAGIWASFLTATSRERCCSSAAVSPRSRPWLRPTRARARMNVALAQASPRPALCP